MIEDSNAIQCAPVQEPKLGEDRFILYRTIIEDDASYDAQFARYEMHPLPPGTDLDTATQSAFLLAEEDRAWAVWVGRLTFDGGVDGVEKIRREEELKATEEGG